MSHWLEGVEEEYAMIKEIFGHRTSVRAGLPYMKHIDEGLKLLRHLERRDFDVAAAWVLHPLYQDDEFFSEQVAGAKYDGITARTAIFVVEYRNVANACTSSMRGKRAVVSPLKQVNLMLIADKVQNYKDARQHLIPKINYGEGRRLHAYFRKWLKALGVSDAQRLEYERIMEAPDPNREKVEIT
jgi:hypothetical protein